MTHKCLLELQALDTSLVFTDPTPDMCKRLHTSIQSLIANKQVSRNLERRLMVQFNTARFHAEQRASMNVPGSRAIARLLCKTTPQRRLITLSSKAEDLKYPNCVTLNVLSDFIRLLASIGGKAAARLVQDWLDKVEQFPSSVTLSAPTVNDC